jgi:hypothetical protein
MSRAPRAAFSRGCDLRRSPGGSFTARARGLFAAEFALLGPDGEEFGQLRLGDGSSAEFRSGDRVFKLEASGKRYRMVADGEEVLTAAPKGRSIDELEISCGSRTYEARISLLRNLAVASHPGGERVAHLSGGLAGRTYEALFDSEDGCALPVAVFLLWHLTTNRRRVYRTQRT